MFRVWKVWNKSITNDVFEKGCSLKYHFPPLDQKIIGTWSVFALLYDDAEGVLVSYLLKQFRVTDVLPERWMEYLSIGIMVGTIVAGLLYGLLKNDSSLTLLGKISKRLKKPKRKTNAETKSPRQNG